MNWSSARLVHQKYDAWVMADGWVELVAASGEDPGEGQKNVEAVEVDAEGKLYWCCAIAALVDAHEVYDEQDAEDDQGQVRVDVGADEVEEHAEEADDDQPEQGSEGVVADAAVVEGEDLRAHAEYGHADGGGQRGVEDRIAVAGV